MDKVTEIVATAETRVAEINVAVKELEAKLQSLKDEKHIFLAVLEAAKKAEQEVAHVK